MSSISLNILTTNLIPAAATFLRQDPTPVPTEAVVYSVVSAEGHETVAMTVFQITTGDLLQSMLLLVIAILLLGILITLVWRNRHA